MPPLGTPVAGDVHASPFGGDMSMMMSLFSQFYASSMGGVAAQFSPTMSFYDQMRQQEDQRRMFAAMQGASAAEAANARKLATGAMHIAGFNPSDPTNAKYLDILQNDYGTVAPYLSQLFGREFVGAMGGRQGSVMLGAQDIYRAGKFGYDPATGNYGMSGQSAGAIATGAAQMLYGQGADPAIMRGIRFDQATDYYAQMRLHRGEGPASVRSVLSDSDLKRISDEAGSANFDIRNVLGRDKASRLSSTELQILTESRSDVAAGATKIDASRMAEYMKDNVGMMRALKDVFGPNTPWAEAMQMARDITQGNAQSLSKPEMENFLRTSKELAEASGMGLQGMMGLTGFLGQYADQNGMSRRGVGQAVQAGAAYQQAFMAMGLGNIDRIDMQKLVTQSSQLTLQAGNSPVAMQLGASLNVDKMVGGFKAGSEAAEYIEALKAGKTTYGKGKSVMLSESEWRRIMVEGGADESLIRDVRQMKDVNTKTAIDAGLDTTVRRLQFQRDVKPLMARGMMDMFNRAGIKGNAALGVADAALGAIMGMSHEMYANDEDGRMEAIKDAIRKSPGGRGLSEDQLTQLAGSAYLQYENIASQRGWGNGSNVKALFDPKILAEQRLATGRSKQMADFNKNLSGIGSDSLLGRVVSGVMEAGPGTSAEDIMKSVLNVISNDELTAAAAPHLEKLNAEKAAYETILRDPKYFDQETLELTAEGKKVSADHRASIDAIIKDLSKSMDSVAPGASKSPGKSSEKDKASADLADGGKRTLTLAGKIEIMGMQVPISGEAFI